MKIFADENMPLVTDLFAKQAEIVRGSGRTVSREQLADVEHALHKFEEGTYGFCDSCGQPIDPERLEAIPEASLCIKCKAQQAKNARGKAPTG